MTTVGRRVNKGILIPSPSVLFSKSCLACSLEMRLLPSRYSRNFCGELRVITQRPLMPAREPALKTAIYDKAAKGIGHTENLLKAFITVCPSSHLNKIAVYFIKWNYFGRGVPLPAGKILQSLKSERIYNGKIKPFSSIDKSFNFMLTGFILEVAMKLLLKNKEP